MVADVAMETVRVRVTCRRPCCAGGLTMTEYRRAAWLATCNIGEGVVPRPTRDPPNRIMRFIVR